MTNNYIRGTAEERFWPKVDKRGPDDCWPWLAGCNDDGYGSFALVPSKRTVSAQRAAWILTYGEEPPPDRELDHVCHTRAKSSCPGGKACLHRKCVNPGHLEPVTTGENTLRGLGVAPTYAARGCCSNGHPFTPENTILRSDGGRRCRECKRVAFHVGRKRDVEEWPLLCTAEGRVLGSVSKMADDLGKLTAQRVGVVHDGRVVYGTKVRDIC